MKSNHKIEKNSNSFTNLSNYENPALLSDNVLDGLEEITDRNKWDVTASSYQADNEAHDEGPPHYIKDGNRNTRWHSRYDLTSGGSGKVNSPPFYFLINLKETVRLGGFQYAPRQNGVNGRFTDYKLFTGSSIDEVNVKITNDRATERGNFNYLDENDNDYKSVRLRQEVLCSVLALQTSGSKQQEANFYAAVCSDFRVYVNRNIESPTESETESPTESETESPTESETESPTENETESPTESETKSKTESESPTENETKTKSEFDTEIDFSSSETEETNINSEKVTQTESDKEEQEYTQSTDEKDDDQSQSDIQYQTSLETKIVTSIITEEIIHPDEETNSPSNVIIMSTNELTSNTPQNTTNVIDNTETELERESSMESSIESSIHIEDSTNSMNTALITGVTVGVVVLIIIVVLLIIFLIYRHKRLEYNSAENDFSVEMDDGALNILDTNNDAQDAYNHSDKSDIGENPFMKDDFIETNNTSDINDNSASNNVDDSQVFESNSE